MLPLHLHGRFNVRLSFPILIIGVQIGQSFKTVGYGCTSCWGDVGAGDAEADVIYITFIVTVQHLV